MCYLGPRAHVFISQRGPSRQEPVSRPRIPRCRQAAHQHSLPAKLLRQSGTMTLGASSSALQELGTELTGLVQAEEAFVGICPPRSK